MQEAHIILHVTDKIDSQKEASLKSLRELNWQSSMYFRLNYSVGNILISVK